MSISNDWSIGVSEYSTESKVIQYFVKILQNKEVAYWSIRVPNIHDENIHKN